MIVWIYMYLYFLLATVFKLVLSSIFNIVLLVDTILLFSINVT